MYSLGGCAGEGAGAVDAGFAFGDGSGSYSDAIDGADVGRGAGGGVKLNMLEQHRWARVE